MIINNVLDIICKFVKDMLFCFLLINNRNIFFKYGGKLKFINYINQ